MIEIEFLDFENVYDIEVEDNHNFFANGFTHFSRFAIFIKIGFVLFVAITLLSVSIITNN